MNRSAIDSELRRRTDYHLAQSRLRVDYYRIRRCLSYPLPVTSFHCAELPLRTFPSRDYPWSIWLSWALEERLLVLGHAAAAGDTAARAMAQRDIEALTRWPRYRQLAKPDLCLGHCLRLLYTAWTTWSWMDVALRHRIATACARAIDDMLPFSNALHGHLASSEDVLHRPDPHALLHNIPIIGTIGAALAARAVNHPSLAVLDRRVGFLIGAVLNARNLGISEALAYDGYVLDFAADWLAALPESARAPFLNHPRMPEFFAQSCWLSAPGDPTAVAEIGDVEPGHMPFHVSAQAKLQALHWDATRAWYLDQCQPEALRSDALIVLRSSAESTSSLRAPTIRTIDVQYAAVLRSGFAPHDLAVAMAASSSPMGHIHEDNGSVVIGTRGRWLIADPGYQQYLDTSERVFTVGPQAHNIPVVNGLSQTQKRVARPQIDELGGGVSRMRLDVTSCYPAETGIRNLTRTTWLLGHTAVVVCDRIDLSHYKSLIYHWHGHPDAGWWIANGGAELHFDAEPDAPLFIQSSNVAITESMVDRLPGSRGQLTMTVPIATPDTSRTEPLYIWWCFGIGAPVSAEIDGARATIGGRHLLQ